jgi:N-acyl-D-aspartate/D-glutamate deacylase
VNVGAYIGFNSAWQNVMGPADKRPSADDIERMRQLIATGLENGAWGVSAGLDYKPAYYATTDEVIKVVEVAKHSRTNFTNHDRLTPESNFSSRTGIAETLAIGEAAGLVPVVTHMKAQGLAQGTADALLDLLHQSSARAHYAAADAYPYLAGQTGLGALIIPAWAQDGGREEMLKRFADPEQRARIVTEAEQAMKARFGGPEGVYLPATQRELTDVMRELQVSAGEAVVRLLEEGNAGAILRFGIEADIVKILQYPATSIACDCGATLSTRTHPRNYGTFPRVLGKYVRETKALTWEDAIRKMTALPANTIGMIDRGFLAPGMIADVTVFDPITIIDHATYEDPAKPSEGIRHVIVNGRFALRDGAPTGEQAGQVLTRSSHMPSRPMENRARIVAIRGPLTVGDAQVPIALDVAQPPRSRNAVGSLKVTDSRTNTTLEVKELGQLQVTNRWASFTGRARVLPSGDERAITVIVDVFDPEVSGRPATVTIQTDGEYQLTGTITSNRVVIGR